MRSRLGRYKLLGVVMMTHKLHLVLFVTLSISLLLSPYVVSSAGNISSIEHTNQDLEISEPPLLLEVEKELAETPQYDYVDLITSNTWGSVDNFINMKSSGSEFAVFSEEGDGANFQFDAIFVFSSPEISHYQTKNLQIRGKNRDWLGVLYEDLNAEWSMDQSDWQQVHWNPVVSGGGMQTLSVGMNVFLSGSLYIHIWGAITTLDWVCSNIWEIEFMRLEMEQYVTTTSLSCDSLYDSDNLYAMKGPTTSDFSTFRIDAYDGDGGLTVDSAELRLYIGSTSAPDRKWSVTWSLAGGYVEDDPNGFISFQSGYTFVSGNHRYIDFRIKIGWNHPIASNVIIWYGAYGDGVGGNRLESTWDVETRLDMQIVPSIQESRVNVGITCTYSGDVKYYGSTSNISPLASEVDVQVRRTNPSTTGWIYSDNPSISGTFSVQPSTVTSIGINTFELRVVADGTTTNLLTSTYSDMVTGDRVVVTSGSVGSSNYNSVYGGGVRNTGQSDILYLKIQWESSGTAITTGTVSWSSTEDTVSMSYDSVDGRWVGTTYSCSIVGEQTYSTLAVNIDGVTAITSPPSYSVLWDEIEILTTVIEGGDDYVNIGNSITLRVTAQLSYMGHTLNPGFDTLYMNGIQMSDGGGYFTYTVSHLNPEQWTYSVDDLNALENTYGITKIATGKPSISCTWDTFSVALSVDDAHVSIDDTVRIWAHVTRAYDGSVFTDSMGSVVLRYTTSGDISMIYSFADGMWYADVTQNSVNKWVYFIYSITDTVEQIDTVGRGLNFDGNNDYVDCGSDSSLDLTSNLTLTTWFYGDGVDWGSGMYLLAKKDNNDAQYSLYVHNDGTLRFVYYNGTIREIDLQSGVTRNTWHHVIVTISGTILNCWYDGVHVRENIVLPASLVSFPSVPLYLGAQKSSTSTDYHLEGFISEIRIYDYVLSEVECKELYCGEDPDDLGMILYLGRATVDTSAGLWNDLSGFGNDGTIHDAVVTIGNLPMNDEEVVSLIWDAVIISITEPITQMLSLGLNASGITVTGIYSFDGLPFDGIIQLNNTQFSYLTPGQRGYTVSSISGDSYGISVILLNDETYAIWVLHQAVIQLVPLEASILVSTIYDPQNFSVDVYITDADLNLISGWANLTIDGEDYVVFCDGIVNSIFYFVPTISDIYTLEAFFEGDSNYSATETSILLTADPRDIIFTFDIPSEMTGQTSAQFNFLSVYDNDFQGDFEGVTYIHNFPINASFSIWWTISSDYENPRIFTGTWNITDGDGTGPVTLPWDLDGNGWLNSADFICYFVIHLDGLGIYDNITIETPVIILHPLEVDLQVPTLTYSDQSTLCLQLHPLHDPSFTESLDLTIALYVSNDNITWVSIGEFTTTTSGWQSMNWTCIDSGTLFFKAETVSTELYIESIGYANSEAMKEITVLTIERVGNFTYSDQGILVAWLSTNDGEPLSDYSVYLEIMDGTWISIGSGLTNESGHVSILWTPILPAGTYSIQVRMSLAGSQFYLTPNNTMGVLVVSKETTVISIDTATLSQGFMLARVTDDDGTPIPSIQVHFYAGSNHEYRGFGISDNDGYTRLNITLNNGELLEAVVNEDDFYYGAIQEVTIAVPVDLMFLGTVVGAIFMIAAGITISRKIIRWRAVSDPPSVSPEVSRALEKERDSIPERVRERTKERIAELDEMGRDSVESGESLSFDESDGVSETDGKVEWELDP